MINTMDNMTTTLYKFCEICALNVINILKLSGYIECIY